MSVVLRYAFRHLAAVVVLLHFRVRLLRGAVGLFDHFHRFASKEGAAETAPMFYDVVRVRTCAELFGLLQAKVNSVISITRSESPVFANFS